MQFKFVVLGVLLLAVGLLAYSSIPNVHRTPISSSENLFGPETISVQPAASVRTASNITIVPERQNELRINLTVKLESGESSLLHFQLFPKNASKSCSDSQPKPLLTDRTVSKESLQIPLNAAGTYCFLFDNESYSQAKSVLVSALLHTSTEEVLITRDGGANMAGLGLGAFGLLVTVYGISRRTVIPWE